MNSKRIGGRGRREYEQKVKKMEKRKKGKKEEWEIKREKRK